MNIYIKGAKQNNLKNIDVEIPKHKMTAVTGISGSGKSSLVFDVIYEEAQRQLMETIGSFSRISMPRFSRPDVEQIRGLATTIIIEQKQLGNNPRSTVGTFTEIYTYLRLLFSRYAYPPLDAGDYSFNTPKGACEFCKGSGKELFVNPHKLFDFSKSLNEGAIRHRNYKINSRAWNIIKATGFFDMDKKIKDYSQNEMEKLLYSKPVKSNNEAVGFIQNFTFEGICERVTRRACDGRGLAGVSYDSNFLDEIECSHCKGSRVNARARNARYKDMSIVDLTVMEIEELQKFLSKHNKGMEANIIEPMLETINAIVRMGVGYMTLSRPVGSLSGGEAQRIRLARQVGSSLTDIIYILDEPTSGLHPKDIEVIIDMVERLVNNENTAIVVEHNNDFINKADYIVELGPKAGSEGGKLLFQGYYNDFIKYKQTCPAITKEHKFIRERMEVGKFVNILANKNNLVNLSVDIPLNALVAITGVSGSGKSSLVDQLISQVDKCIIIDQSKIGTNTRSNPVTYVDAFTDIRKEFARESGIHESMFAFNGKGACKNCGGLGYTNINMHFLGDVKLKCETCGGKRYLPEVLEYRLKGKNIAEVLEMTVDEAKDFFDNKDIGKKLEMLSSVGLGYLCIGQSFDTVSGGEAQRIRLSKGLSKDGHIYILDEPTRGLHTYDTYNLLRVLSKIVELGNTVIVVEHNLDIISNVDYIIDLGPGAGKEGGKVIAKGSIDQVLKCMNSYTARYLKKFLDK